MKDTGSMSVQFHYDTVKKKRVVLKAFNFADQRRKMEYEIEVKAHEKLKGMERSSEYLSLMEESSVNDKK
jgi:hypothetical protein